MTQSLPIATSAVNAATPSGRDDTAALQSLFNSAGAITLPAGTYLVSGTLTLPQWLEGAGYDKTIIRWTGGNIGTTFPAGQGYQQISGITFDGQGSGSYGFGENVPAQASGQQSVFRNCRWTGWTAVSSTPLPFEAGTLPSCCVYLRGAQVFGYLFDNCVFDTCLNAVYIGNQASNHYFHRCRFRPNNNAATYGAIIDGSASVVEQIVFDKCANSSFAGKPSSMECYRVNGGQDIVIMGGQTEVDVAADLFLHVAGSALSQVSCLGQLVTGNGTATNAIVLDAQCDMDLVGCTFSGFTGVPIIKNSASSVITEVATRNGSTLRRFGMWPASGSGAPSSGTWSAGDFYLDSTPDLFIGAVSGTPGTFKQVTFNPTFTPGSFTALAPVVAPSGVVAVDSVVGQIDAGNHYYVASYTSANATESALSAVSGVVTNDATHTSTTVTLPALPTGATGWKLYRTLANAASSGPYYLVVSQPSASGATYVDKITDAAITAAGQQGAIASGNLGPGLTYQNTTGKPYTIYAGFSFATAGGAATLQWKMHSALSGYVPAANLIPGDSEPTTTGTHIRTYPIRVPVGWYFSWNGTNVTLAAPNAVTSS